MGAGYGNIRDLGFFFGFLRPLKDPLNNVKISTIHLNKE